MNPFFMQLAAPSGLRRWFLNHEKIWLAMKSKVSLRLGFWGIPYQPKPKNQKRFTSKK